MSQNGKTLVLVADDEPSTRALVTGHLKRRGYRVIEASDGDEAWDLAHEHLPDLVVLDVMMPGMSGWEVCRKIREAVSLAHTGVVMLTGIGENLNEMTSPLYGADAYVDKPFEFSALDAKVTETLSRRQSGKLGRSNGDVETEVLEDPSEPKKANGKKASAKKAAPQKAAPKKAAGSPTKKAAAKPEKKAAPKRAAKKAAPKKKAPPKKTKKAAPKKTAKKAAKKAAPKKKAPKKAAKKPAANKKKPRGKK
jgi:DNA-binding response OmpR family regulator